MEMTTLDIQLMVPLFFFGGGGRGGELSYDVAKICSDVSEECSAFLFRVNLVHVSAGVTRTTHLKS